MMIKHLLITGGAGFIGSNAVNYFLSKYPEYIIINLDKMGYAASMQNMQAFYDNPRHIFIKGDITDKETVEHIFANHPISGVIHFAAESHVDNSIAHPEIFIQTNVVGTFILLEAAKKFWASNFKDHRFHHISTDEVYGSLSDEGIFTEESPYAPNSPYSASKAASDHLVRSYHKTYGLNAVITNCSNNFGPHQHDEKLIPTIIRKALANQAIPIYGQGLNVRDWIYVEDHCEALAQVFHHASAGAHFNIGGNNEITNIKLAQAICKYLDEINPLPGQQSYSSFIQYVSDRPGHDFRYAVAIDKIRQELGWLPSTPFEEALKTTINYYLKKYTQ